MTLWVRVQAHPSRRDLLPALLERLEPLPVEVRQHSSIPPDPWAGYVECLKNLPECSHILIIQDDAIPCENFPEALELVAQQPSRILPSVSSWVALPASTAAQARRALEQGQALHAPAQHPFVPLVAVLWPREKAQAFLDWSRDGQDHQGR